MNMAADDLPPRPRRSNVFMKAFLDGEGAPVEVRLRNLSKKGALVEAQLLPEAGKPVLFRKGDLAVPGCVVWRDGRYAGVAFDVELEPETLLRHIPAPRPAREFKAKRPPIKGVTLSAGERRLAEDYIFGQPIPGVD